VGPVNVSTGPHPCCLVSRTPTMRPPVATSTQFALLPLWREVRQPASLGSVRIVSPFPAFVAPVTSTSADPTEPSSLLPDGLDAPGAPLLQ
jgi:hypothetical protein